MIYHDPFNSLDDLPETVRDTVAALRPRLAEFDLIAVTGTSGIVVGIPVGQRLKKPVCILRKDGDSSHAGSQKRWVNQKYLTRGARALFLDDFIASGETAKRVEQRAAKFGVSITLVCEYRGRYTATGTYGVAVKEGAPEVPTYQVEP